MARRAEFYTRVGEGASAASVGYSSTARGGVLGVRFAGPDGRRLERMTACKVKDANYHVEAARLIAAAYAATHPTPGPVTWDDAMDEVGRTSTDLRAATLVAYRKSVKVFRETLDADAKTPAKPAGPADVTEEVASRFARVFLSLPYRRGKSEAATARRRKPTTLAFHLRQLSAVWELFRELAYVKANPWRAVRRPQTDRAKKGVPTEEAVAAFFAWVRGRYPKWERLHCLLELKALSGCRSLDVCQLRTDQLRDGRVVWEAGQVKQREGRAVSLPATLFDRLRRLAGPTHLWEHVPDDMRLFRPSRNRLPESFDPMTVYWLLGNVFREYADAHPDRPRLSPHGFRRRAITLVATQTQSVDATAQAIGLNPSTARNYYLDARRAFDADELFKKAADLLLPKSDAG